MYSQDFYSCGRRNGFVVDGGRLPLAYVMLLVVVCIYFLHIKKKKNKKPAGFCMAYINLKKIFFRLHYRARSRVFLACVYDLI